MIFSSAFIKMIGNREFFHLALGQIILTLSRRAFFKQASHLVRGSNPEDLIKGPRGNRAQLVNAQGQLVDDLVIEQHGRSLHILNTVSPGLTSALAFAQYLVQFIKNL